MPLPDSAPPPHSEPQTPAPNVPPPDSPIEESGHPTPLFWKYLGWGCLIAFGAFVGFMLYAGSLFHKAAQIHYQVTDTRPDPATLAELRAKGWPDSIHRVIHASSTDGFFGDGTSMDIYFFDSRDVQRVKDHLSKGRAWKSGHGGAANLLHKFKGRLPADAYFDDTTPAEGYLFIQEEITWRPLHVIDTVRGIYYIIFFRT